MEVFHLILCGKKDVESDDCGSTEKDGFAGEILTVEHVFRAMIVASHFY